MSIPTTQLAALASQQQPISVEEVKVPAPSDDQLLVKITSAAINPVSRAC